MQFEIDKTALANAYHALQKNMHPDRFANASQTEKRYAIQITSMINQAFQTLKNPLTRAAYLLESQNIDLAHKSIDDKGFLMEQFELREQMSELNDNQAINNFLQNIETRINTLYQEFNTQYQNNDFHTATNSVLKLQFLDKLYNQTMDLQD